MLHLLEAAVTGALSWWMNFQHPRVQCSGSSKATIAAAEIPGSLLVPPGPFQQSRGAPEHPVRGDVKVALGHCHPLPALCPVFSPNTIRGANLGVFLLLLAGDARWQRSGPGSEPFCLVATEMGRGVNAAMEAELAVEPSCSMSIKELPVPSNVPWGGQRSYGD